MFPAPIDRQIIDKYNYPGPRYTSYPTPPNWNPNFGAKEFYETLRASNRTSQPLSLYFHLPFCSMRCTFCACSIVATRKREVVEPYLKALLREIDVVAEVLDPSRKTVQIHWGGGTPTYLSSKEMEKLFLHIRKKFRVGDRAEISAEVDPRVTTDEQLMTLKELGFNRVSLGLQDFAPEVQKLSGRIQSETETRHIIDVCRFLNFESVNLDLVYGLPSQTLQTFQQTLQKVISLGPNRIALFNFAYVPWIHAHQKQIFEKDLPGPHAKLGMFCLGIETFEAAGFDFIGLDHFAKKEDELTKAKKEGTMYRNFQGYTTHRECDLIGFGVTAISSVHGALAQNAKKLKEYQEAVLETGLTTHAGLQLSAEDLKRQAIIRELFCHQKVFLDGAFEAERKKLKPFEADGLVRWDGDELQVTRLGRLFLRNIGMVFDAYLQNGGGKFSRTV